MLFLLIMIGSAIFVSIAVLHIRKNAFERRLEELAERKRRRLGIRTLTFSLSKRRVSISSQREAAVASGVVRGNPIRNADHDAEYEPTFATRVRTVTTNGLEGAQVAPNGDSAPGNAQETPAHITIKDGPHPSRHVRNEIQPIRRRTTFIPSNSGVAVHSTASHPRNAQPVFHGSAEQPDDHKQLRSTPLAKLNKSLDSIGGYIGRNSQFHHLSEKERRILGGIEYDAICFLSWLVPIYFVLFQLFGALGVGAWVQINRPDTAYRNGQTTHALRQGLTIF